MKRLLAYLFIVLGLGLMFNVNANAGIKPITVGTTDYKPKNLFKESKKFNRIYSSDSNLNKAYQNVPPLCEKWGMNMIIDTGEVVEAVYEIISNPNKKLHEFNFNFSKNCPTNKIVTANYEGGLKRLSITYIKSVWRTAINDKKFTPTTGFIANTVDDKWKPGSPSTYNEFSTLGHLIILFRLAGYEVDEILKNPSFRNFNNYYNKDKTLIAKKEPSQTQDYECKYKAIDKSLDLSIIDKKTVKYKNIRYEIMFENKKYILFNFSITLNKKTGELFTVYGGDGVSKESTIRNLIKGKIAPVYANCEKLKNTQIAKKEPKKKEKKVAKKKLYIKILQENENRIKIRTETNTIYSDAEKFAVVHCAKYNKSISFLDWQLDYSHSGKVWTFDCVNKKTQIAKKEPKKKKVKVAKKTKKSWKCKLFGSCQAEEKAQEEKTQQVAKKIINIFCVKNNYSKVRMVKGEKPNCKNDEFNVVKNEYILLETLYGSLESYFDLSDPNEVVLFERRVTDLFKITHQDFNNLTETQQVAQIETTQKGFNLFKREEKKITLKEVLDLGKYAEFNAYPEGMLKEFKQCKKPLCRGKIAGKKVYKIFVQRSEIWHQRHPGNIIHGMAWFEIFYLEKLKKTEKQIARYVKNGPKGYSNEWKMKKDVNLLHGLIKTNKGRIKMRQALGLSLNDDLETVLKRHWLLGDFLNKDKLKIKKVKISSDIKKREALLAKYKSVLTRYKNKLDEERRATN